MLHAEPRRTVTTSLNTPYYPPDSHRVSVHFRTSRLGGDRATAEFVKS